jgi:uncharacterized membrane protein YedE/YeeE
MIELIKHPWPWHVSGTAIAVIMILLLYFGKSFGFSSNLKTICSMVGAGKHVSFFNFDWKQERWNLLFLLGAISGGFIAGTWLESDTPYQLSPDAIADLKQLGIPFDGQLNPSALFSLEAALSVKGFLILLIGGVLIGFGTRYAAGCTSGHGISGLSNLQIPSLIAVVDFFAGGLIMTHFLLPLIF